MNINKKSIAYITGFNDGFEKGEENNQYESEFDRFRYKMGYDTGVSEYCRVVHPEDYEDEDEFQIAE